MQSNAPLINNNNASQNDSLLEDRLNSAEIPRRTLQRNINLKVKGGTAKLPFNKAIAIYVGFENNNTIQEDAITGDKLVYILEEFSDAPLYIYQNLKNSNAVNKWYEDNKEILNKLSEKCLIKNIESWRNATPEWKQIKNGIDDFLKDTKNRKQIDTLLEKEINVFLASYSDFGKDKKELERFILNKAVDDLTKAVLAPTKDLALISAEYQSVVTKWLLKNWKVGNDLCKDIKICYVSFTFKRLSPKNQQEPLTQQLKINIELLQQLIAQGDLLLQQLLIQQGLLLQQLKIQKSLKEGSRNCLSSRSPHINSDSNKGTDYSWPPFLYALILCFIKDPDVNMEVAAGVVFFFMDLIEKNSPAVENAFAQWKKYKEQVKGKVKLPEASFLRPLNFLGAMKETEFSQSLPLYLTSLNS